MARRLRLQAEGDILHITQHGIDEMPIFGDDDDRGLFLRMLAREVARSSWTCLGYCLMKTHYHVVVRLQKETLSSGLQHLNGHYAMLYNRFHGRRGHLFEARFRDVVVESEPHRYEVARYVHLNPVRAGICKAPEEYPWSDYAATAGLCARDPIVDPREALSIFGDDLREARERYRAFVAEADLRIRRGQTRV